MRCNYYKIMTVVLSIHFHFILVFTLILCVIMFVCAYVGVLFVLCRVRVW